MKPDQYICGVIITGYKLQKNNDPFEEFLEKVPTVLIESLSVYKRMVMARRKYETRIEFQMDSDSLNKLIVNVHKIKDYLNKNVESFYIGTDIYGWYSNLSYSLTNYKN